MKRKVVVLGATGSIGRQALDVVAAHPDRFELVGIAAGSDERALATLSERFPAAATALGDEGSLRLAGTEEADVVLNGIVGAAGLKASIAALESGKTLALANKESLVAGGEVCLAAARRGQGRIVAVDSEHAALAQCLEGRGSATVARVLLTASGGPFRERLDLEGVTRDEALAHPTWAMGPKITIDSATLMNKGLEVIEAHFLCDLDYDRIDVVVHPQSVVHAMVELVDGTVVMQAAPTDMRIPIQAALTAPDRVLSQGGRLDIASLGELSFDAVDRVRFPALDFAYAMGRLGATFPAAMNAANEVAVHAFLDGTLRFVDIVPLVERVVTSHEAGDGSSLHAVLEADRWARAEARAALESFRAVPGGAR